jgi:hypothetical protein
MTLRKNSLEIHSVPSKVGWKTADRINFLNRLAFAGAGREHRSAKWGA